MTKIQKLINTEFNDVVTDEIGQWTEVCYRCAEQYEAWGVEYENAGKTVCGRQGCTKDAEYYLCFNVVGTDREKEIIAHVKNRKKLERKVKKAVMLNKDKVGCAGIRDGKIEFYDLEGYKMEDRYTLFFLKKDLVMELNNYGITYFEFTVYNNGTIYY